MSRVFRTEKESAGLLCKHIVGVKLRFCQRNRFALVIKQPLVALTQNMKVMIWLFLRYGFFFFKFVLNTLKVDDVKKMKKS